MQVAFPNPAEKLLLSAAENPITIRWQESERLVTPLTELFYAGRTYLPARSERPGKAGAKQLPHESFKALSMPSLRGAEFKPSSTSIRHTSISGTPSRAAN
jgi:hypothetical protein